MSASSDAQKHGPAEGCARGMLERSSVAEWAWGSRNDAADVIARDNESKVRQRGVVYLPRPD
jgi:hypothetical protein